jgi:hypothetical protein
MALTTTTPETDRTMYERDNEAFAAAVRSAVSCAASSASESDPVNR